MFDILLLFILLFIWLNDTFQVLGLFQSHSLFHLYFLLFKPHSTPLYKWYRPCHNWNFDNIIVWIKFCCLLWSAVWCIVSVEPGPDLCCVYNEKRYFAVAIYQFLWPWCPHKRNTSIYILNTTYCRALAGGKNLDKPEELLKYK